MYFTTQVANAVRAVTQRSSDVAVEVQKAIPAVTVVTAGKFWDLQNWVYAATFIYIVLQAAYLVWKWWREANPKGQKA